MTWRSVRPIVIGVPLVLAAWFVALLALTLFEPGGRPVAVVSATGADGALAAVIAADGYLVQVRGNVVIAISDDPGFVPRLYRNGALFVMASSPGGCIVAPTA